MEHLQSSGASPADSDVQVTACSAHGGIGRGYELVGQPQQLLGLLLRLGCRVSAAKMAPHQPVPAGFIDAVHHLHKALPVLGTVLCCLVQGSQMSLRLPMTRQVHMQVQG